MIFSMAEELSSANSDLELAKILKDNNNCVSTTLNYLGEIFEIAFQTRKQLEALLLRVRSKIRKAKIFRLLGRRMVAF